MNEFRDVEILNRRADGIALTDETPVDLDVLGRLMDSEDRLLAELLYRAMYVDPRKINGVADALEKAETFRERLRHADAIER